MLIDNACSEGPVNCLNGWTDKVISRCRRFAPNHLCIVSNISYTQCTENNLEYFLLPRRPLYTIEGYAKKIHLLENMNFYHTPIASNAMHLFCETRCT